MLAPSSARRCNDLGRQRARNGKRSQQAAGALFLLALVVSLDTRGAATAASRKVAPASKPSAVAAPPTADALLASGRAARLAGELDKSRELLTRAYTMRPDLDGLRELGLLAHAEQRTVESQDLLRRYLQEAESDPAQASARTEARALVQGLPPPCARLRIAGMPGDLVFLDGRVRGTLPLSAPLLMTAEEHKLRINHRQSTSEAQIHVPTFRTGEVVSGTGSSGVLVVEILPALLLSIDLGSASGDPPPPIDALLARALEKERLSVLPVNAALEFSNASRLAGCLAQVDCQTELARLCAIEYALRLRIGDERRPGPEPVRLELIESAIGERVASTSPTCTGCSWERLADQLAATIATLVKQTSARPRGQLEVLSEPPLAEVVVNGQVRGQTPYRGAAWVGTHSLIVRRPGLLSEERRLVITDGQTTSVRLQLSKQPDVSPQAGVSATAVAAKGSAPEPGSRLPRPRWRLVTGGLALGGAALLVGLGSGGLAISGRCVTPPAEPDAVCSHLYDTTGMGAGLVGAGSALGISGVLLLSIPGPRRLLPPNPRSP